MPRVSAVAPVITAFINVDMPRLLQEGFLPMFVDAAFADPVTQHKWHVMYHPLASNAFKDTVAGTALLAVPLDITIGVSPVRIVPC